jgi:hypothetical protein
VHLLRPYHSQGQKRRWCSSAKGYSAVAIVVAIDCTASEAVRLATTATLASVFVTRWLSSLTTRNSTPEKTPVRNDKEALTNGHFFDHWPSTVVP